MKKAIVFILSAIILISCFKEKFWDEGPEVTRKISFENFDTLELNSIFDISLIHDTINYGLITCGENLIGDVKIILKDNKLLFKQASVMNCSRTYRRTHLDLHFVFLSSIVINSSVKMESGLPLNCPTLAIWDRGELSELDLSVNCTEFSLTVNEENVGIYKISGKTVNSSLTPDGSAHFRLENLAADSCSVIHSGIGDCYVNAGRILTGKIVRDGRLYYKNYPDLKVQVENKNGRIIQF